MGSALDELKAQIVTKEEELTRITDELDVLRRALAIMSGRRTEAARPQGQTLLELIVEILQEAGEPLLGDVIVSKAKAKGSQATRQTILGAAYRATKTQNKLMLMGRGLFWLIDDTDDGKTEQERKIALA